MKSIIAVIDHHMHTLDLDEMISTTTMRIPNSTILHASNQKTWEGLGRPGKGANSSLVPRPCMFVACIRHNYFTMMS